MIRIQKFWISKSRVLTFIVWIWMHGITSPSIETVKDVSLKFFTIQHGLVKVGSFVCTGMNIWKIDKLVVTLISNSLCNHICREDVTFTCFLVKNQCMKPLEWMESTLFCFVEDGWTWPISCTMNFDIRHLCEGINSVSFIPLTQNLQHFLGHSLYYHNVIFTIKISTKLLPHYSLEPLFTGTFFFFFIIV